MKCFVIFLSLYLFHLASCKNQMIVMGSQKCKSDVGASDDDVNQLASGKAPGTPEGKCLINCMGEEHKIITDNKLNLDGFVDKVAVFSGKSKKEIAKEVGNQCTSVTNEESCQAAYDIWKCIEDECVTRNVTLIG